MWVHTARPPRPSHIGAECILLVRHSYAVPAGGRFGRVPPGCAGVHTVEGSEM